MVVPSPAALVAQRIRLYTELLQPICFTGFTMGGGANHDAVRSHLDAGLPVYALPEAALTFHDNLERVRAMGITVVDNPPERVPQIFLQDLDLPRLQSAFACFDIKMPSAIAVAVQDHGFSPRQSNRLTRIRYWKEFLDRGGMIRDWVRADVPSYMTRMLAVRKSAPTALILDTGMAAILGALQDGQAMLWQDDGLTVVNVGNFHTLAALVRNDRVYGIYEHHSASLTVRTLRTHLEAFRRGLLEHERVFQDGGHGCAYGNGFPHEGDLFERVLVTGPRRRLLSLPSYHQAAPYGDMMLSGCFGLLRAAIWSSAGEPVLGEDAQPSVVLSPEQALAE
jgi:uncharacterized protein (DUF1786 family)